MPDNRRHRGKHPRDDNLFAPLHLPTLRRAVAELSWLLSRGYSARSALKLVGDRHALQLRQRTAVARCACSDEQRQLRRQRQLPTAALADEVLAVDGLNVLIIVESALSGGLLLRGRDGCFRDLASIHGTYRAVQETPSAAVLLGEVLCELGCREVRWYLDRPVSNSGRLKTLLGETAAAAGWPWRIELCYNPDRLLAGGSAPVASSDGWIIERCERWVDLVGEVLARRVPERWALDLGG